MIFYQKGTGMTEVGVSDKRFQGAVVSNYHTTTTSFTVRSD